MTKRNNKRKSHKQSEPIKKSSADGLNNRGAYLCGLRACRLMAALSQRELAQKIGAHQSTISDLENLYRGGYPAALRRLCEALEVEPAKLLYGGFYEKAPKLNRGASGTQGKF